MTASRAGLPPLIWKFPFIGSTNKGSMFALVPKLAGPTIDPVTLQPPLTVAEDSVFGVHRTLAVTSRPAWAQRRAVAPVPAVAPVYPTVANLIEPVT